ncbi:50S ribosomal protein L20 [Patescibacteria group bacterium]|nr:MAG: 50S ribosomal protein L20 [Patescibacteria group bacterium]
MSRVKGGPKAMKRRRNILKAAKGYRFGRSTKTKQALEALKHAGKYAFRDRRAKKRTMRGLAIVRINAALRERGFKNYSTFMGAVKKANIELDRKVLAEIASEYPEAFDRVLKKVTG